MGLLIAAGAMAADYFPLHAGNQWVYRQEGRAAGDPVVVEVRRIVTLDGRQYAELAGLPEGATLLRMGDNGVLYAYNAQSRQEEVWAEFETAAGGRYRTAVNPCNQTAEVVSRAARVRTPAGEFENALHIGYPGANCADAGLTEDYFLPWIGLVKRTSITIAGPRGLELVYARVGGVTVLSAPEHGFALTLDRSVYDDKDAVPVMTARMTLRVVQAEPLELSFASGQRFDLILRDGEGKTVYRWSDGKAFTLAFGTERIGPGERNYVLRVPLADASGRRLPPGVYTAEGLISAAPPAKFTATASFEVR